MLNHFGIYKNQTNPTFGIFFHIARKKQWKMENGKWKMENYFVLG